MFLLRSGLLTKADLLNVKDMYEILLYILLFSGTASIFIRERKLRFFSILTAIAAFTAIWFSDKTFTPEYNKYPLYVPGEKTETEEQQEEGIE